MAQLYVSRMVIQDSGQYVQTAFQPGDIVSFDFDSSPFGKPVGGMDGENRNTGYTQPNVAFTFNFTAMIRNNNNFADFVNNWDVDSSINLQAYVSKVTNAQGLVIRKFMNFIDIMPDTSRGSVTRAGDEGIFTFNFHALNGVADSA